MTVREYTNANDEFGRFIAQVRDDSIDLIASLLDPATTSPYPMLLKRIYSETHNDTKVFSAELVPALVDEVITVLLQRIDKASLIDGNIDILYSKALGETVSDDSLYKNTDSLGLDYVDEWRRKYGRHKIIDVE